MLWDGATCCHHGDRAKGGRCTVGDSGPVPKLVSRPVYVRLSSQLFSVALEMYSNIQTDLYVVKGSVHPI